MSCDSKDREFSIVIDINENYESYKESAKSNKDEFKNKFVLFYTTWNDYGYYTLLVVRYFCENPVGENLGTIRICHDDLSGESEEMLYIRYFLEKDYGPKVIIDKDKKLSDKYISIADSNLYENLKKVFGNDERAIEFLSRLNEISTKKNNKRIENIKDVDWYKKSFIRYNEEIVAFTECKNILGITENSYEVKKMILIFLWVVGEALARLDRIEMDKSRNEIELPAELKIIMKEDKFKISDFLSKLNDYSAITDKIKIEELKNRQRNDEQIYASLEHKNNLNNNCCYFKEYILNVFEKIRDNIDELYKWVFESELSYAEKEESLLLIDLSNQLKDERIDKLMKLRKRLRDNQRLTRKIDKILDKYLIIYNNIDIIKGVLKVKKDMVKQHDLKLGHYTSLETIKKLIKNKNRGEDRAYLRLTNGRQMNDPLEGKVLLDYILSGYKDSDKNTSSNTWESTDLYMSSATTELDSLPMWKQYGKDATGGMLVYDNEYILKILDEKKLDEKILDKKVELYKVAYIDINENNKDDIDIKTDNITEKDVKILKEAIYELRKAIEDIKNSEDETLKRNFKGPLRELNDIAFLFKKSDYAYESEYRIVVNRENSKDRIVEQVNPSFNFPFLYTYLDEVDLDEVDLDKVELKYSKLILGPKAIDIDYVAPYIHYCDEDITIQRSSISYR